MGTLNAALAWAQRGFSVFPLAENSREPAFGTDWNAIASSDPEAIRRVWTDPVLGIEKEYNIGCACTGIVVIDIDVKKGKDGYNEYMQMGGTFDTLMVHTPSGGYHCYFHGPDSSNAPLSNGVDVRSNRGYVVAPGSTIDGVPYTVISDRDMAWVPPNIEKMLRPPYVRTDVEGVVTDDSPASIEAGRRFLESAPPAIEGQRGDETTFITAARLVREFALSVPTAFFLMRDHWNERCSPPWEHSQLLQKIENAAAYGSADKGKLTAESHFGHLNITPPPAVFERVGEWGNAVMSGSITARRWIVDKALMQRAVTLLLASGSAGKSSVSLALAAHLALGKDFAGYKTHRKCKTIVYNGEDDLEEQSRRLLAICMVYGFDYDTVKQSIMLLSPHELRINLASGEGCSVTRNETLIEQIITKVKEPDVGLLILDPLVKIHQCQESDNVAMDSVMEVLTDIAYKGDISVLVLHHTSKGGNSLQEARIGNMDIARGASSVVNAARIAFTLLNASSQDAEDYGLQDEERHMWVRLDDAKMNMTLASDKAVWFHKEGVRIPSLDVVGVLKHEPLNKSRQHIKQRVADILISQMEAINAGSLPVPAAVSHIKEQLPHWRTKPDAEIRREIEGLFGDPFIVRGKTLHVKRDVKDVASSAKMIITLM